MEKEISVIVPVYNVEKTLDRCLKSILNQTFKNYEIILVDDGSTDNSGKICDNYAQQYDFISVIHKENEGLGPTRNAGVKAAKGKYIYHCDSDDWIVPDTLEKSYSCAEKNDSDVVIFGYTIYTCEKNNFKKYASVINNDENIIGRSLVQKYFVENFNNYFIVQSACNKFMKRSFLIENDIWFKPLRRCQDITFSLDLFDKTEKLSVIGEAFYEYVIEPNVYKGRSFEEMIDIYLTVYSLVREHFVKWNCYDCKTQDMVVSLYCAHISNYSSFYIFNKINSKRIEYVKKIVNNENINELFSNMNLKNEKSKFLRSVCYAISKKNVLLLYFFLQLHDRVIKIGKLRNESK